MNVKPIVSVADLSFDTNNANLGNKRGSAMLRESLQRNGAGRSVVVDRDGRIIAGNKTVEAAAAEHIPVRVVQTDGSELVVVQRTDLDLQDPVGRARELAFADNRVAEVNLTWDQEAIDSAISAGLDMGYLFNADDIAELAKEALDSAEGDVDDIREPAHSTPEPRPVYFKVVTFYLRDEDDLDLIQSTITVAEEAGIEVEVV